MGSLWGIIALLALFLLFMTQSLSMFWIIVILLSFYLLNHQRKRFMPTERWRRYRNWRKK